MKNRPSFANINSQLSNKPKYPPANQQQNKPSLADLMYQFEQNQYSNINLKLNSEFPKIKIEKEEKQIHFGYRKYDCHQEMEQWARLNLKKPQSPFRFNNKQNIFQQNYKKKPTHEVNRFADCIKQLEQKRDHSHSKDQQQCNIFINKKNNRSPIWNKKNVLKYQDTPFSTGIGGLLKQPAPLQEQELVFRAKGIDIKTLNFSELAKRYHNTDQTQEPIKLNKKQENLSLIQNQLNRNKSKSKLVVASKIEKKIKQGEEESQMQEPKLKKKNHQKRNLNVDQIVGFQKKSQQLSQLSRNSQYQQKNQTKTIPKSIQQMKEIANKQIQQFARGIFKSNKSAQSDNLQSRIQKIEPKDKINQIKQIKSLFVDIKNNKQEKKTIVEEYLTPKSEDIHKTNFFSFEKDYQANNNDVIKFNTLNTIIQQDKSLISKNKSNFITTVEQTNSMPKMIQSQWPQQSQSITYLKKNETQLNLFKNAITEQPQVIRNIQLITSNEISKNEFKKKNLQNEGQENSQKKLKSEIQKRQFINMNTLVSDDRREIPKNNYINKNQREEQNQDYHLKLKIEKQKVIDQKKKENDKEKLAELQIKRIKFKYEQQQKNQFERQEKQRIEFQKQKKRNAEEQQRMRKKTEEQQKMRRKAEEQEKTRRKADQEEKLKYQQKNKKAQNELKLTIQNQRIQLEKIAQFQKRKNEQEYILSNNRQMQEMNFKKQKAAQIKITNKIQTINPYQFKLQNQQVGSQLRIEEISKAPPFVFDLNSEFKFDLQIDNLLEDYSSIPTKEEPKSNKFMKNFSKRHFYSNF